MRVAIIGAGPSGLVTLKYLVTAHHSLGTKPVEVVLFEAEDSIGGTFAHRTYEDAELVSSKQLTTFSDFRSNSDNPDFLSTERYLQYLHDYCTHFKLWPHIKLSSRVLSVRRRDGGGHRVSYINGVETVVHDCDANVPTSLHSSEFKTKSQFGIDKTVLILGSGETGMDVAYMAVNSPTKQVLLSHRDGLLQRFAPIFRVPDPVILPILGNKPDPTRLNVPVDSSSASLFDTAYVHPRLRDHMLLWEYYDFFIKSTLWLVGGSKYGLGQFVGGISDKRYHASKIFFNKSNKAMPYISAPYEKQQNSSLIQRIRSSIIQVPISPTHGRHIDLAPWPSHFDKAGTVNFTNNGRPEYARLSGETIRPDVVVFATGYTQTFPFLSPDSNYHTPSTLDTRSLFHSSDPTIGYIGFIRPSFGAIPLLSELQAQLWTLRLLSPSSLRPLSPKDEAHYKLHQEKSARIQYGVDHESYAHQLALDMSATVGFWEVLKMGWDSDKDMEGAWYKLPLVWALGANFNAKFRLKGPWEWNGAKRVLVEELWDTVERRGGFFAGHITLSGLPMLVFGTISLVLWMLDPLLVLFEGTGKKGGKLGKKPGPKSVM
ncbi:hypothetical protein B0T16DRAFT_318386 [Cercophora newfieldiana]|uniref:Flavin-containing monooxygenase n=1 Tax=Cercophora newfieldiana TaxID=92897 RepID=A0AA39YLH7_9PEZI|nr:hypothetical protein B0T16DRAFT_318386 [Cercophora newfieldiana]